MPVPPRPWRDVVDAMAASLLAARRVLITGHSDPDGDVAGGCSALYCALKQLGKEPTLYNPDPTRPVTATSRRGPAGPPAAGGPGV